ncbi:hypothetical protein ACLOJK_038304 [Asimina triloba]
MVIGDGVLTPCISVLSAVGGIKAATNVMTDGTEAMLADLGHFSVRSIQISTCSVAFSCLVLAYAGQSSYLREHMNHILYIGQSSIIASQAMISGTFSIIQQALTLGCFPLVKVVHTSAKYEGQVYISEINHILMIACVAVTAGFQTTVAISNAYGLAVVFVTTLTSAFLDLMRGLLCGCEEQKQLGEILQRAPGVYGARFSGAGFGGCCIAFVDTERAVEAASFVRDEYCKVQPDLASMLGSEGAVLICEIEIFVTQESEPVLEDGKLYKSQSCCDPPMTSGSGSMSGLVGAGYRTWTGIFVVSSLIGFAILLGLMGALYIRPSKYKSLKSIGHEDLDLELEEILMSVAIWRSIQDLGQPCESSSTVGCRSSGHVSNLCGLSPAFVDDRDIPSADSIKAGLAVAVASMAEHNIQWPEMVQAFKGGCSDRSSSTSEDDSYELLVPRRLLMLNVAHLAAFTLFLMDLVTARIVLMMGQTQVVLIFLLLQSLAQLRWLPTGRAYGEVLFSSLPPFTVQASLRHGSVAVPRAGEDIITVIWGLNGTTHRGVDSQYEKVKVEHEIIDRPYTQSNKQVSIDWMIKKDVPTATYFVRAYVVDDSGKEGAYGQNSVKNKATNLFSVQGTSGRHASLDIAAACFSAFAVVSLFGFFYEEKRKAKKSQLPLLLKVKKIPSDPTQPKTSSRPLFVSVKRGKGVGVLTGPSAISKFDSYLPSLPDLVVDASPTVEDACNLRFKHLVRTITTTSAYMGACNFSST